ncbi:unnamed protein product [Schistosoma margrebowiei]|uniref:Uncharacterized protein n=1 Tax=Schistosoma margrebowiei TaxID=48269 RepID=A0A183MEG2_9TREM|nr:unnamed protein product [Schistosoma margrebowiei]
MEILGSLNAHPRAHTRHLNPGPIGFARKRSNSEPFSWHPTVLILSFNQSTNLRHSLPLSSKLDLIHYKLFDHTTTNTTNNNNTVNNTNSNNNATTNNNSNTNGSNNNNTNDTTNSNNTTNNTNSNNTTTSTTNNSSNNIPLS